MRRLRPITRLRYALRRSRLLQIGVLLGFWLLGQGLSRLMSLPVPGGIIGMALLLALLAGGLIRPPSIHRGANWLIAEMLLFFVPAVMVVLDHGELLGLLGLKLAAAIVAGTVLVMAGTALVVDFCSRWSARLVE
ncbi:MAG: CidA/LrgA family protein [Nevskiales bacterium]